MMTIRVLAVIACIFTGAFIGMDFGKKFAALGAICGLMIGYLIMLPHKDN